MTCFRIISKSKSKKGPKQKKNIELKNNLNKFFKNSFYILFIQIQDLIKMILTNINFRQQIYHISYKKHLKK